MFWVFFVSFAAFAAFPTPSSGATAETFYENALRRNGINAFAATCQSAHETGFWTSSLWRNANNGAGIKADKNWIRAGRPTVRKKSQEVVGGKWTTSLYADVIDGCGLPVGEYLTETGRQSARFRIKRTSGGSPYECDDPLGRGIHLHGHHTNRR